MKLNVLLVGSLCLLASYGSLSADEATTKATSTTLTVNAGYDQVVPQKTKVSLSAKVNNQSATYQWVQTAGTKVTLKNAKTSTVSFTSPSVTASTTLSFKVTATDSSGTKTDQIKVEVWSPFNTTSDPTLLGDFSKKTGWSCNQDLSKSGLVSTVNVVNLGSTKRYTISAIPKHAIGTFPNAGNPNVASQQLYMLDIPTTPTKQTTSTAVKMFGFTTDGVTFDRNTAECYNNSASCDWRYEAVTAGIAKGAYQWSWLGSDCNNGHVQPNGNYHYHGLPESLINKIGDAGKKMVLMGYAADGFPIYGRWGYTTATNASSAIKRIKGSYRLKSGTRPSGPGGTYDGTFIQDWEYAKGSGDLDECNGRFGVTPEYPNGSYHYFLTDSYPFIPSCVYGKVVDSDFLGAGRP
ncbi:MAG: YHYH protein [Thiolinea sp.]